MEITCENKSGEKFHIVPRYKVLSIDGLGADFDVYTSQNSGQDGGNYNGSNAKIRNIVIVFDIYKTDPTPDLDKLYNFFQPRSPGTIYYTDGQISRKTTYYTESVGSPDKSQLRTVTLSLICPDPKWYALEDQLTELAAWEGLIEWDLEITEESFALTEKINTLIGNVYNDSAVPMGLTVIFRASGTVVNPSLYDVNRHELMQISTTMHSGDKIVITTGDGNKRVKLISGGVTSNINNRMTYPPRWLKAYQGDNLYRYNADEGIDNLSVTIKSTQAYWGA